MRHAAALAALVLATVALPGGAVGGSAACAAEENRFAIVVDFGDAPGAPSATTMTCVPVDSDDTAADALVTRARILGRPRPTYNNAGLLCSIDGFPESGCGDRTATGYRYWSYWFGGEAWSYASTGPAFHRAKPGGVVGWRFQPNGVANSSDPPPRSSPRFGQLCPAAAAGNASPTTARPAPPPAPAPATPPPTNAPGAVPEQPATRSTPAQTDSTTTTASLATATTSASDARSPVTTDSGAGSVAGDVPDERGSSNGASWPLAAGGVGLAAALGVAAALKARRR